MAAGQKYASPSRFVPINTYELWQLLITSEHWGIHLASRKRKTLYNTCFTRCPMLFYTLSEAWRGVNWADLMAAQGAFGTDFYDRSILRPKHRAYYRSGRPVIKIGRKGALGSHEICPIHSAPSLGQSICHYDNCKVSYAFLCLKDNWVILWPVRSEYNPWKPWSKSYIFEFNLELLM